MVWRHTIQQVVPPAKLMNIVEHYIKLLYCMSPDHIQIPVGLLHQASDGDGEEELIMYCVVTTSSVLSASSVLSICTAKTQL